MRITGGEMVSRRVNGPSRDQLLRPTPDALREQAFAVLKPHLAGCVFLDLFAGTGVVSLEALSRGANRCVLVEVATSACQLIERNITSLGIGAGLWKLYRNGFERALNEMAFAGVVATVAWCDPPFASWTLGQEALALARTRKVLDTGALAVIETPPRYQLDLPGFEVVRQLRGALLLRVT